MSEAEAIVIVESASLDVEQALELLAKARGSIADCRTPKEALKIAEHARALEFIMKAQKAARSAVKEAENVEREAKKRAGVLLAIMPKARGTKGQLAGKGPNGAPIVRASGGDTVSPPEVPTYGEMGIDKKQASRLMKLAAEDAAAPPKPKVRRVSNVPVETEAEIVRMAQEKYQAHEIAAALGVKPGTVHHVKRRNGVSDRAGDPLYRLRESVVEFRDALESASTVAHRWDQATPEQMGELDKELGQLARVVRALRKRLGPQGDGHEKERSSADR